MKSKISNHASTAREYNQEKVLDIFEANKNKPIAIAINGEWGVGKTYFWKNHLAPKISEKYKKYPIYISVFGKSNENEIIQDLVAQYTKRKNKIPKTLKNLSRLATKTFGLNVDVGFIFGLLEATDLRDAIICIDDFERLSGKIPPQDILGLIAELKENKECQVIVLYNDSQLFMDANNDSTTKERKILEKYQEKIFDFRLNFTPNAMEQLGILDTNLPSNDFDSYEFLDGILSMDSLLRQHQNTNLRTLQKVSFACHSLVDFFRPDKYPSKDFEKTHLYLLYSITYAYYFKLQSDYFENRSGYAIGNLLAPYHSLCSELLRSFLPGIRRAFDAFEKTSSVHVALMENQRNWWINFVTKMLSDTQFHKEYLAEYNKIQDNKVASINFFLKHKNNTEAFPYIFGFRILNYGGEATFGKNDDTTSFHLEYIMQEHQKGAMELFDKWCDETYDDWSKGEYLKTFWLNVEAFSMLLKDAFKKLGIEISQNKLTKQIYQIPR